MTTTFADRNPDHELLVRLARNDPDGFNALRDELIEQLIARAPEHIARRLRGLQFRIDQVRQLAHTPLNATIKVSQMMWSSFYTLKDELSSGITVRAPAPPARVIPLPVKRTQPIT